MKAYSSILIVLFLLSAATSFSQSGVLDASFGTGGKVVTPVGDSSSVANAVVVTPEGKIVAGGTSFVAGQSVATLLQYNSDGTLDTMFGEKGKAQLPFSYPSSINSIALQADGKVIAVGYCSPHFTEPLITRFNSDGRLDSSFGINGKTTPVIIDSALYAGGKASKVIIKPNGKIVVGGATYTLFFDNFPFVMQYLPDGTSDSSFGTYGETYVGMGGSGYTVNDVNDIAIADNGNITLAINEFVYLPISSHIEFQLNRLLPNGTYDSTFGTDGVVRTGEDSMWKGGKASSVVVLPDSSVVSAGYLFSTAQLILALVKYHSNGTPDSTFGIDGKAPTTLTGYISDSKHLLLLPDGKFIVTGYTYPSRDFVLVKFLPDGTPDSSFGDSGITTTDFSGTVDFSYSSALQADGKIVLAGSTGSSTNYSVALARYNNNIIYPLRLLSFTAVQNGVVNSLQWQTAQEVNAGAFEVQRSANGKEYSVIGYVNAGSNPYHFTDYKPMSGSNYYRIKIVDKNGTFTYSPVRLLNNSQSFIVKVYPNPVRANLQLQTANKEAAILQWQIVSADGKVLMANQWQVQVGTCIKNINVAALSKGNYYLIIMSGNRKQSVVTFEKM